MSRLPVFSEQPTGGDRVYLDTLGTVSSVRFTTTFPGGDWSASWQMILDPHLDHRAVTPGRLITIPTSPYQGWHGILDNPQRGEPWQFTATGRAQDGKRFNAYTIPADPYTATNTLILNDVIDQMITRGSGWTRGESLPNGNGQSPSGAGTVEDVLNQVADDTNQYWKLSRTLVVTMDPLPTTVTNLLVTTDTAGGRQLGGFLTDVFVTYIDDQSWAPTVIVRSASSRPFGRFEGTLDRTADGPIPLAQAQQAGDNYLNQNSPRLRFTGGFTVTKGQWLNSGGTPADLATAQAGNVCKLLLIDPDTAAGEKTIGPVTLVIGQTDYDVDADILTVTPVDTTRPPV